MEYCQNYLFYESIKNAYGSLKGFEREIIHKALEMKNSGKLYFSMNRYYNFKLSKSKNNQEYTLLTCNLDCSDIYNFIEDIDYNKLSNAYLEIVKLIESK